MLLRKSMAVLRSLLLPLPACFAIAQPLYYALHEQEGNSAGKREREVERKGSVKEDKGERSFEYTV